MQDCPSGDLGSLGTVEHLEYGVTSIFPVPYDREFVMGGLITGVLYSWIFGTWLVAS